jgi:hypothetical protein
LTILKHSWFSAMLSNKRLYFQYSFIDHLFRTHTIDCGKSRQRFWHPFPVLLCDLVWVVGTTESNTIMCKTLSELLKNYIKV